MKDVTEAARGGADDHAGGERSGRRRPRRLLPDEVLGVALDYLRRYDVTEQRLRQHLTRRAQRSASAHGDPVAPLLAAINAAMEHLRGKRLLDDVRHGSAWAGAWLERGISPGQVRQRLRARGVSDAAGEAALAGLDTDRAGYDAARAYAARRRFGPYGPDATRLERREREIAKMYRAGHRLVHAIAAIDGERDAPPT